MQRSDFYYELPPELIAQRPLPERSASRLLLLDGPSGLYQDLSFTDLPHLLRPDDLLVFNDTRVIPARLFAHKLTGGRVEVLVERLVPPDEALAQLRCSKPPAAGSRLRLEGGELLTVIGRDEEFYRLRSDGTELTTLLERQGHVPLPPYIRRADEPSDRDRYQTVYAERPGAVAAPTAGLHFDQALLDRLHGQGVVFGQVTLHVGAGTFQPVRSEDLAEHRMHAEWFEVSPTVVAQVAATRRRGGRVIAVGTTSVRSLEAAASDGELTPCQGETRLFIRPGFEFRVVDALITNFHLPESTLLMLVSAFAGHSQVMSAYRHAVHSGYRFFSYGDAMFVTRRSAVDLAATCA